MVRTDSRDRMSRQDGEAFDDVASVASFVSEDAAPAPVPAIVDDAPAAAPASSDVIEDDCLSFSTFEAPAPAPDKPPTPETARVADPEQPPNAPHVVVVDDASDDDGVTSRRAGPYASE